MALRTESPHDAARPLIQVVQRRTDPSPDTEDDPLAPARGILYAAIGGAAVWAALIGGAVTVIQRLR